MNDEMFGAVRPEPRLIELIDTKRSPGQVDYFEKPKACALNKTLEISVPKAFKRPNTQSNPLRLKSFCNSTRGMISEM